MIKVAILDDYQNAFQQIVDVEKYNNKLEFKVKDNFDYKLDYSFKVDQNYEDLNYNELSSTINFDPLKFNVNYLQAKKHLGNKEFRAYSFKKDYIDQSSHYDVDSLTEFTPEYVKNLKAEAKKEEEDPHDRRWEIQDDTIWEEWANKYINPLLLEQKYDLIIDEPAPHVYLFPLFTKYSVRN